MTQRLRFAELYKENRKAVEQALRTLWTGKEKNESQRAYAKQIKNIISNIFASDKAMPLVQTMNSYETIQANERAQAEETVTCIGKNGVDINLWKRSCEPDDYAPYVHQVKSWEMLLNGSDANGKPKSICVTTGTGSGKTECFMLPLVKEITNSKKRGQVQAIFLYPLNALMDDQKERLEKLVAGTGLRYAVYNAELPERHLDKNNDEYPIVERKIKAQKGTYIDENGEEKEKFPNCVPTREEVRDNPPEILLTNPTMLEYILLRRTDKKLVDPVLQSLRWIVIDETHTYTGSGAAELAMQLRRVLIAYNVSTDDIRFATSSATLGNDNDAEVLLKDFICNLTGIEHSQLEIIRGDRKGVQNIPQDGYAKTWHRLLTDKDGYMPLDELINTGETVEEKLEELDRMCESAEQAGRTDMRVKVHYFYHVPNGGLYVDLEQYDRDGALKVMSENTLGIDSDKKAPYIELSRCRHCGEYVAVADVDYHNSTYSQRETDDSDMFDLGVDNSGEKNLLVFGLTNEPITMGSHNVYYEVKDGHFFEDPTGSPNKEGWRLVGNTQCCCPYCKTKLTKASETNNAQQDEEDTRRLQKFRISAARISRLLAPSTLNMLTKAQPSQQGFMLHDGQQYISFVDSRQAAAQSSLAQNLEEEKRWVYSAIYHELCRMKAEGLTLDAAIQKVKSASHKADNDGNDAEYNRLRDLLDRLKSQDSAVSNAALAEVDAEQEVKLSWRQLEELFLHGKEKDMASKFCFQFITRSDRSNDIDTKTGMPTEPALRKYVNSILITYLAKRPKVTASPETLGLFRTVYDKLETVKTLPLPQSVEELNKKLDDKITPKDWHDLMEIFIDYTVRSNESIYIKYSDDDEIDIFQTPRYATEKEHRRPVKKPSINAGQGSMGRIVILLLNLLAKQRGVSIRDVVRRDNMDSMENISLLQNVIEDFWKVLTVETGILKYSTHYDQQRGRHVDDEVRTDDDGNPMEPWRLNVCDISVTLYDEVYLVDSSICNEDESIHVETLRPVGTLFKGYSPYTKGNEAVLVLDNQKEKWVSYPYYKGNKLGKGSLEEVRTWVKEHRKLLWDNGVWGDEGEFTQMLDNVHMYPDLFIQAEHTAQVDKTIARQVQKDFKNHQLNILACSTTMEMGVDLGSLEVVMMTSVPPQPANYKQRAGRSGRRGQVRSAAITLCGSDMVGMRTLLNPMENVVTRQVEPPIVDLVSSRIIIQRHVNALMVREFNVFHHSDGAGTTQQKVLHYYTTYDVEREDGKDVIKDKTLHHVKTPDDELGSLTDTSFESFDTQINAPLSDKTKEHLERLLNGTALEGKEDEALETARLENIRCYEELKVLISEFKTGYGGTSPNQRKYYFRKYREVLLQNLLQYWATNRFIPNANMPVDVIEFDFNGTNTFGTHYVKSSNPSYSLKQALSQYAPGTRVTRDGVVRIVRGIRTTNSFKQEVGFKKLYHDDEQVVIDLRKKIKDDKLKTWKTNGKIDLELIQPVEFIPDTSESANRILDHGEYTRVKAQLIGTEKWDDKQNVKHLFQARPNSNSGNAKILYYNEGVGYGYCYCMACGRTVLEHWAAAKADNPDSLPDVFNPLPPEDDKKPFYHNKLITIPGNKPKCCNGSNSKDLIRRNVVLGDLIQTDYTEIRICHKGKSWISVRTDENKKLLTTLGILLADSLAEILGISRINLDFTITANGHICVFDTNEGGAGYANQLAGVDMMNLALEKARGIVDKAISLDSVDALIDRTTLRYIKDIDVKAAKEWLDEEKEASQGLPSEVKDVFPSAEESSLAKLKKSFSKSTETIVFIDNDYKYWNYDDDDEFGWKSKFFPLFAAKGRQTTLCVTESESCTIPEGNRRMLGSIKEWMKDVVSIENPYKDKGLWPLAYIDGVLFFTNDEEHKTMDDLWAGEFIYSVQTDNPMKNPKSVDTKERPDTKRYLMEGQNYRNITSDKLGEILQKESDGVIDKFIDYAKGSNCEISVSYLDKHLKSLAAMVITLQTIEHIMKQIGKSFTLEFQVIDYYEDDWKQNNVFASQTNVEDRDEVLSNLADKWMENFNLCTNVYIAANKKDKDYPHYRELRIQCGDKALLIEPDGGFGNGWYFDKPPYNSKYYEVDNTTTQDKLPITRIINNRDYKDKEQKLRFEFCIENVNPQQ